MAGSDEFNGMEARHKAVSIHAPDAGSDRVCVDNGITLWEFQSTPPMQGATVVKNVTIKIIVRFNPRPLCRERLFEAIVPHYRVDVSIHAPYAGSDFKVPVNL